MITKFTPQSFVANADLSSITLGPDGKKLWFTEKNASKIGNFAPP